MSTIQFGLPFEAPVKQTILPLITDSGRIYGFFPITQTTFEGTETSFTVASGTTVTVTTVTLPPVNTANVRQDSTRVQQYMAAYFPIAQESLKPWTWYSTLVRADEPNPLGYYSWWSAPVMTIIQHFGRGAYLDGLKFTMNQAIPAPTSQSTPNVSTPQSLTWATSANILTLQECSFIDFNWVALFQSIPEYNPDVAGNTVVPVSITVTSNPSGGYFKAFPVQSQAPSVYPGGGAVFNTVRILRLQDPPTGTYTFNFNVQYTNAASDASNSSVAAVLNLTVE